jgi:hypothetical protein
MDTHLLNLRRECHEAAGKYHRAMEQWQTVSRAQEKDGAVSDTLLRYRDIAAGYHNALETLSAYLLTLEPTQLVAEETERTLRLQALLDREIELIF